MRRERERGREGERERVSDQKVERIEFFRQKCEKNMLLNGMMIGGVRRVNSADY